jgi:hypothetical protein
LYRQPEQSPFAPSVEDQDLPERRQPVAVQYLGLVAGVFLVKRVLVRDSLKKSSFLGYPAESRKVGYLFLMGFLLVTSQLIIQFKIYRILSITINHQRFPLINFSL